MVVGVPVEIDSRKHAETIPDVFLLLQGLGWPIELLEYALHTMHRWFAFTLVASLAASSFAERFITIPMGRKVPFKAAKLQVLWNREDSQTYQASLGLGIAEAFDIDVTMEDFGRKRSSVDFSYSFVDPVVGYGPGLSLGVRDLLDETAEGTQLFVVGTVSVGNNADFNQDTPTLATIGVFFDDRKGKFFVGVSQPITNQVLIVTEHNSRKLVGGFELRPLPDGWARFLFGNRENLIQVGYLKRF